MDELHKQLSRARRRLTAEKLLKALGWSWFLAILTVLTVIGAGKLYPLGLMEGAWIAGVLAAATGLAVIWTFATRHAMLEIAVEIDHRFGLKERVSSTLAMPSEERQTEAGQALLSDALRRIGRIDVAEKFRIRLPRQLLLPVLPGVVLAGVTWWFPAAVAQEPEVAENQTSPEVNRPEVKRSAEALQKRLSDRREKAEKEGLKDATELLRKLEHGAKEITEEPKKEKALVKLNDLARQLDGRRRQLGGAEQIRRQLEQLKTLERGPAEKFAQAMKKGDFKKAAEELEKLKTELGKSKLDEAQKEELARQLEAMQDKIGNLAKAAEDAKNDLQKRADQLHQDGREGEANKLEEQIAKLGQQAPQMQNLQELADQLGQCANCMKQGQGEEAAQALRNAQEGLQQLQRQIEELEMLDGAREQLAQAREHMNCAQCKGAGCEACQGAGAGERENGQPDFAGGQGPGIGKGRGGDATPDKKIDAKLYDSQVRQKVGKGAGTVTDLVHGPNIKGNVEQEIQQQVKAARQDATDPLSGRRVPKRHGEHAREYFDRFREGK